MNKDSILILKEPGKTGIRISFLLSSDHCICNVDDRLEGVYHLGLYLGCLGLQVQKNSTQSDLGCREICFSP